MGGEGRKHEYIAAEEKGLFFPAECRVFRISKEEGAENGGTRFGSFTEEGVKIGEEGISALQGGAENGFSFFTECPGFLGFGAFAGVVSAEGEEGAEADPLAHELRGAAVAETAEVWAVEGLAGEAEGEGHGDTEAQMCGGGEVVAGPGGAVALAAEKVGACEDEGAAVGAGVEEALAGGADHLHAVDVVVADVRAGGEEGAVAAVEVIGGHGVGGAVEDGGFVHVVPQPVDVVLGDEASGEAAPPGAGFGAGKVGEFAVSGPDAPDEVGLGVGCFNPVVSVLALLIDGIGGVGFNAGVDHPDAFEVEAVEFGHIGFWIGEGFRVKGENTVTVHIIDIHPHDVAGDPFISEGLGDAQAVCGRFVTEAALLIAQSPEGGQGHMAGTVGQLPEHVGWIGSLDDEEGVDGAFKVETDLGFGEGDGAAVGGIGQDAEG